MIVTFYSFKGGVGRSMAMAACAYLFAQRGLRTLAIDFDLEAPGLERYFFDDHAVLESVRARPGLIDLVLTYKRALTNREEFERADFKQWRTFVEEAIPATSAGGCVDLITAGMRAPEPRYGEYALAVRSFDWQDFFHNWRGDRFFDWFRRELTQPDTGYDVVLVDARTGVTEMGGVCAYQLADTAVLLCAANYQNLDGTKAIVDDFRSDAVTVLRHGRPIEIVVVPARVEDENEAVATQREQFFVDFQRTFGSDGMPMVLAEAGLDYRNLALKYQPELAILERLVDSDTLGWGSFERLTDALMLLTNSDQPKMRTLREESFARLTGHAPVARATSVADVTKRGAGYDVLLTYAEADRIAGGQLCDELVARGIMVWAQPDGFTPRDDAAGALRALEYSEAIAIAIGRADPPDAHWLLLREALIRRKPVVPVLLPGCDKPAAAALSLYGVQGSQAVDLREGTNDPKLIDQLGEALGLRGAASDTEQKASRVTPYPGREAFTEDQSAFLFGRERDCDALLQAFDAHDIVVLSGAAGVGKTSLVHAGLLPRIRRKEGAFAVAETDAPWVVEEVDATDGGIAAAIDRIGSMPGRVLYVIDALDSFPDIGDKAKWNEGSLEGGGEREVVARLIEAAGSDARFLLVWRELLSAQERNIALSQWGADRRLIEVRLEPLAGTAIRDVIEKPASAVGHLLEPGLADRLMTDCGALPGAIAQLQIALGDMWEGRRRGWLTNRAYDAAGGIAGRYAARLQAFLNASREDFGQSAHEFVRALVRFDSGLHVAPFTRTWAELSTIRALQTPDAMALCERLATARLIDVWRDSSTSKEVQCSLSHAVVPRFLKDAIAPDAAFILWRQRLSDYVAFDYAAKDMLLTGDALGEAERWEGTHAQLLTDDERGLIRQSKNARDAQESRRRRTSRIKAGMVVLALLLALGAAFVAAELGRRRALGAAEAMLADLQSATRRAETTASEREFLAREVTLKNQQLANAATPAERDALQKELARLNDDYKQRQAQATDAEKKLDELRKNQVLSAADNTALIKERDDLRKKLQDGETERKQLSDRAVTAETAEKAAQKRILELDAALKTAAAEKDKSSSNDGKGSAGRVAMPFGDVSPLGAFVASTDIGKPTLPGSAEYDAASGRYRITGSGADIWGTLDEFQYVWRLISGDVALSATVEFLTDGHPHRKAVLMLRKNTDADSPFVQLAIHGDGLPAVQFRNAKAGHTNTVDFPVEKAGKYKLRLDRQGTTITASIGRDDAPLKQLGQMVSEFGNPILVGLGVTSHSREATATVSFSDVTVLGAAGKRP